MITVAVALFAKLVWGGLCLGFLVLTEDAPPASAADSTLPAGWDGLS